MTALLFDDFDTITQIENDFWRSGLTNRDLLNYVIVFLSSIKSLFNNYENIDHIKKLYHYIIDLKNNNGVILDYADMHE